MDEKHCRKCDTTKPVEAFGKNRTRADGLMPMCKACKRTYNAAYHAANRAEILARQSAYRTVNRDMIKKYKAVYREANQDKIKAQKAAYREVNRDKIKEYKAAYNAANRDKINARQADYYETNREYWAERNPYLEHPTGFKECRRKHGTLPISSFSWVRQNPDGLNSACRECANAIGETRADREAWRGLARTRPPCAYCGEPSEHIDHVVPVSRGGRNVASNYLPACAADNLSKSNKWVYDFLFGAEHVPDRAKPNHYRTWDASLIRELFAEIERDLDACP